jgi:2'-5' RNA ligase
MSDTHSIWLMPDDNDLALLQAIVERLSDEFGTPRFCPHLTLVEDMERTGAELSRLLSEHFANEQAFRGTIRGILGLPMFFRSLYASFAPEGSLLSLKTRSINVFSKGDIASFMPHISLAYGFTDLQRSQVANALEKELHGRVIHFDSIAVVASAQAIPIGDWEIVYRQHLSLQCAIY